MNWEINKSVTCLMPTTSTSDGGIYRPSPQLSQQVVSWSSAASSLPPQLIECLKLSGFDSPASLGKLKDINEVECFLRENGELLMECNRQSATIAYGIFRNNTQKFKFLPGHKVTLEEFVKKGKEDIRKSSRTRLRSAAPATPTGTPSSPTENAQETAQEDMEFLETVADKVQSNLKIWIKKQEGKLAELKEHEHYSIYITQARKEVRCLLCNKSCLISRAKDSYLVSNYTRHVSKTCDVLCRDLKLSKKKKKGSDDMQRDNAITAPQTVEQTGENGNDSCATPLVVWIQEAVP